MGIQHAKKVVGEFRDICISESCGIYIRARIRSGKDYTNRCKVAVGKVMALRSALAKNEDYYGVVQLDKETDLKVWFSTDKDIPGNVFVEKLWDLDGHEYFGAEAIELLKQDEYNSVFQWITRATDPLGDNFGLSSEELEEEGKRLRGGSSGSAA